MAGLKDTIATLTRMRGQVAGAGFGPVGLGLGGGDTGVLTTVGAFGGNPGKLVMKTYLPAGLGRDRPLVVVLHGCTQSAEAYALEAGWVELAERYGFGLVCPEQVAENNPGRCFNWFNPGDVARGKGEAASIAAMVETAAAQAESDRSQIYVTGLSAGGGMAAVMLATYPEVFAGGGIIAGLPYGVAHDMPGAFGVMTQGPVASPAALGGLVRGASRHKGRWPRVSIWHGTADATVRVSNADAGVNQWLDVNGLAGAADETVIDGRVRLDRWTKGGAVVVERRLVEGMGHGTPISTAGPDGAGRAGPFVLDVGVSSSVELLRFWGVAEDEARTVSEPVVAQPAMARMRPAAAPVGARAQSIGDIINGALRSAGLMK